VRQGYHEWIELEMDIRIKMRMKKDTLQVIKERQLRWYGHVMRMEDCRIARHVAESNSQGKRRRGRPVNS
jgi:hypothetical protein